jgi:hypothetical protein
LAAKLERMMPSLGPNSRSQVRSARTPAERMRLQISATLADAAHVSASGSPFTATSVQRDAGAVTEERYGGKIGAVAHHEDRVTGDLWAESCMASVPTPGLRSNITYTLKCIPATR